MAKKKKPRVEEVVEQKPLEFLNAKIRDGYCDYGYKIKVGPGAGNTHNVTGEGIIDDDLARAFSRFNAHLAYSDEVFKSMGLEVENIDDMHDNPITDNYRVDSFKIKGSKENESIILFGTKYSMTLGDHLEIKTAKIIITGNCFYKWYNELKLIADMVRDEVEQYHNGKCTAPESESEGNPNQLSLVDQAEEADIDLETSRVD